MVNLWELAYLSTHVLQAFGVLHPTSNSANRACPSPAALGFEPRLRDIQALNCFRKEGRAPLSREKHLPQVMRFSIGDIPR